MTKLLVAALAGVMLTTAAMVPAMAQAPAAAAAPAAGKLSIDSNVSVLLANDKSKAILQKYIPIIVEYADMIPDLDKTTLKQLGDNDQAQSAGGLTPDVMKQIAADLAKL
jgi:hypothetical protein